MYSLLLLLAVEIATPTMEFTDTISPGPNKNLVPNSSFELGGAGWSSMGTGIGWGDLDRLRKQRGQASLICLDTRIAALTQHATTTQALTAATTTHVSDHDENVATANKTFANSEETAKASVEIAANSALMTYLWMCLP